MFVRGGVNGFKILTPAKDQSLKNFIKLCPRNKKVSNPYFIKALGLKLLMILVNTSPSWQA